MSDRFPEHQKLMAIKDENDAIGEFLEWLESTGVQLCDWIGSSDGGYVPICTSYKTLLAQFFRIDEKKLEAEKRQMLDELRKMNLPA